MLVKFILEISFMILFKKKVRKCLIWQIWPLKWCQAINTKLFNSPKHGHFHNHQAKNKFLLFNFFECCLIMLKIPYAFCKNSAFWSKIEQNSNWLFSEKFWPKFRIFIWSHWIEFLISLVTLFVCLFFPSYAHWARYDVIFSEKVIREGD